MGQAMGTGEPSERLPRGVVFRFAFHMLFVSFPRWVDLGEAKTTGLVMLRRS